MDGFLELEPTQAPFRACIAVDKFVEVRFEPQMREEDVFDDGGPGGRSKPKKIGTRMVPSGNYQVMISTSVQGYSVTFSKAHHGATFYEEIREALKNGGGIAQDLTPGELEQQAAAQAEEERARKAKMEAAQIATGKSEAVEPGSTDPEMDAALKADAEKIDALQNPPTPIGLADKATAEVEADGYEADGEFYNNEYTCVNCNCDYSYECADPMFEIACPDCGTNNKPEDILG